MVMNALRNSVIVAALLLVLRVYLGWSWLTSGWGKVTGEFVASGFIQGAITDPVTNEAGDAAFPWYVAFLVLCRWVMYSALWLPMEKYLLDWDLFLAS
ncbi:hypothetical protein [Salibacterium salarium]|uniref:hypothetical protein n=1 Tax=Salibacterium salarium TaxID=284579 RepID=UPI0026BFA6C2